jgi:hypothetical protein
MKTEEKWYTEIPVFEIHGGKKKVQDMDLDIRKYKYDDNS